MNQPSPHSLRGRQVYRFLKHHGIADWLTQIAPYLQLCHIHQVTSDPVRGARVNHRAISDPYGVLINYFGVLAAIRDVASKPFPLLIEVREEADALQSYQTIRKTGLVAD